jgi:hypothetical protein
MQQNDDIEKKHWQYTQAFGMAELFWFQQNGIQDMHL